MPSTTLPASATGLPADPPINVRPLPSNMSVGDIAAVLDGLNAALNAFKGAANQPRCHDIGSAYLDDEVDRIDGLKAAVLDELERRKPANGWEASIRLSLLTSAAATRHDWPEVARLATLAAGASK